MSSSSWWTANKDRPLTQEDGEVLGFHPEWIDEDFNPKGTRIGFIGGEGMFISAYWWDYQDCYVNGEQHDGEGLSKTPTHYIIPSTEGLPR